MTNEIKVLGNYGESQNSHQRRNVYDKNGISPTLQAFVGGVSHQ
jgi:hypothetical protein